MNYQNIDRGRFCGGRGVTKKLYVWLALVDNSVMDDMQTSPSPTIPNNK